MIIPIVKFSKEHRKNIKSVRRRIKELLAAGMTPAELTKSLNHEGVPTVNPGVVPEWTVHQVINCNPVVRPSKTLTNEERILSVMGKILQEDAITPYTKFRLVRLLMGAQ